MEAFAETYAAVRSNTVESGGMDHLLIDGAEEMVFSRYEGRNCCQTLLNTLSYSEDEDEMFEKYFVQVPE